MDSKKTSGFPKTIRLNYLAELSGFTDRHLRDLSKSGKLPPIDNGQMPVSAIADLYRYLRRDSEELVREKLRKTIAERKIAEIEADRRAGLFRSVDENDMILAAFAQAFNRGITAQERPLRDALLAAMPPSADSSAYSLAIQTAVENAVDKLREALKNSLDSAKPRDQAEESCE